MPATSCGTGQPTTVPSRFSAKSRVVPVSPDALASWRAPSVHCTSSDAAIKAALTVRATFRLALRQAKEGFVESIFALPDAALPVPGHATFSRHGQELHVRLRTDARGGPDLAIGRTGLRVAWPANAGCNGWRKLRVAVDPDSGRILFKGPARSHVRDNVRGPVMLGRIAGRSCRVYGDGAYAARPGKSCPTPRACLGRKHPKCAWRPRSTRQPDAADTLSAPAATAALPGKRQPGKK